MQLINMSENNFSISKEHILAIAREQEKALEIGGKIKGGANLYSYSVFGITLGGPTNIPVHAAKTKVLDFKPALVHFDANAPFAPNSKQELGTSRVALNSSIKEDIFDAETKPSETVVGEAFPENPAAISGYTFEGYNTKKDGTGTFFKADSIVNEEMLTDGEMTVYATWSIKVLFNKNTASLMDKMKQQVGSIDVLYGKSLETGNFRHTALPTVSLAGYRFKEWNTKADGTGKKLDVNEVVDMSKEYFAIWEKEVKRIVPNTATK